MGVAGGKFYDMLKEQLNNPHIPKSNHGNRNNAEYHVSHSRQMIVKRPNEVYVP